MGEGEQEHHVTHTALSQGAPSTWASRSSQGGPKQNPESGRGQVWGELVDKWKSKCAGGHRSQERHKESRVTATRGTCVLMEFPTD